MKFYAYKKREAEKVVAILRGGWGWGERGRKRFEVVLTRELEVLAILMTGCKTFPPFKRGARKVLPCLERVAQKVLDLRFSNFVAPPPRN